MFLADGFEEAEALVTLDLLRRAAVDVRTVGIGSEYITGTHNICVKADMTPEHFSADNCDGIILPGGMPGTENLYADATVQAALDYCYKTKKLICAICAAPIIPGRKGYLKGIDAVCFPGFEDELLSANVLSCKCVNDKNFITAAGAGCVFEFAHNIISYILNADVADEIISAIQHEKLQK